MTERREKDLQNVVERGRLQAAKRIYRGKRRQVLGREDVSEEMRREKERKPTAAKLMFSHALGSTSGDSMVRGLSILLRGSWSERGKGVGDAEAE